MSRESFDRFNETIAHVMTKDDGEFVSVVFLALGSWGWVVFRNGEAVMGARSWHAGAYEACEAAELAVGELKVKDDTAKAGVGQEGSEG